MAKFKPLRVIDLDDERTKPTANGWTFCFRLSDDTSKKWDELFEEVQPRRWWQSLMFASKGRITLYRIPSWRLRFIKRAVEKHVRDTNYRYLRWLEERDELRAKKDAQVASFRQTLFGKKRKRGI